MPTGGETQASIARKPIGQADAVVRYGLMRLGVYLHDAQGPDHGPITQEERIREEMPGSNLLPRAAWERGMYSNNGYVSRRYLR